MHDISPMGTIVSKIFMGHFKHLTNKGPGYDCGFINIIVISHIPPQNVIPRYVRLPFPYVALLNLTKNVSAKRVIMLQLMQGVGIYGKTLQK